MNDPTVCFCELCVLQGLREHKQSWNWGGCRVFLYTMPVATSLLFTQSFKERKWVCHNRNYSRSSQFWWAGEIKETTEGEVLVTDLQLLDSIWVSGGNGQSPSPRDMSPATAAMTCWLRASLGCEVYWPEFWGKLEQGQTQEKKEQVASFVACFLSVHCWVFRNWLYPTFVKQEFCCSVCRGAPQVQVRSLRGWHRYSWCQCHTALGSLVTPCPALLVGCLASENH